MKILIVEDELFSAEKLEALISALRPDWEIEGVFASIEQAYNWFSNDDNSCDLIFLDIHLSDGVSFDLLKKVNVKTPIIFTTAYDQYAIQAFKHNSIDYLLKPIDPEDLKGAITKFEEVGGTSLSKTDIEEIETISEKKIKKRFLVKKGSQFESIPVESIAYFKSANKLNFIVTNKGQQHVIEYSMDQLFSMLPDENFFRINRGMIINMESINEIHSYFNGRLKLDLLPHEKEDVLVSRDRVSAFKEWLDR